ncbi:MAG: hypothetical protein WCI55_13520 [Armatimonadota bacterium]
MNRFAKYFILAIIPVLFAGMVASNVVLFVCGITGISVRYGAHSLKFYVLYSWHYFGLPALLTIGPFAIAFYKNQARALFVCSVIFSCGYLIYGSFNFYVDKVSLRWMSDIVGCLCFVALVQVIYQGLRRTIDSKTIEL